MAEDNIRSESSLAAQSHAGLATAMSTLNGVRSQLQFLHVPGVRDRVRQQIERVIDLLESILEKVGEAGFDADTHEQIRRGLLEAHTLRAEDARYGAGQLARGSQRAPTEHDCEDGWQRVESIAMNCEASALAAARLKALLGDAKAARRAQVAERAAKEARQILEQRNYAYTFHTDPGFSFGEGWYVAAAALLSDIRIQLEQTTPERGASAEQFLAEAGLSSKLVPYRSRPRANKALPAIVAQSFASDAREAQARLRAAFLGEAPIPSEIQEYAERQLGAVRGKKTVLLWVRDGSHHKARNTNPQELQQLYQLAEESQVVPVIVGDALRGGRLPVGAIDLTLFWRERLFQEGNARRAQLQLFELMKSSYGLVGQVGVTSAGMDGPALMGLPTMYITETPNVRLGLWVGVVPGYEEVVRNGAHLVRVSATFRRWANAPSGQPTPSNA